MNIPELELNQRTHSRRGALRLGAAAAITAAAKGRAAWSEPPAPRASIAITLDLEMSRQYPQRDDMRWDYEKGNLDTDTKRYAVEAARRVKQAGGVIHFFVVGRVFEQEDVSWLQAIAREGHPIGNHTYDHVNVHAKTADQLQFRFQRAPWLIEGKSPAQVIEENIRLCTLAMKHRLGIEPAGFRTPGGFTGGLRDRPDVRKLIAALGFTWISSLYPAHPMGPRCTQAVRQGILEAQAQAQPFAYGEGILEVPMSPVSDVTAFRAHRWKLTEFVDMIESCVTHAIDQRSCFDFLAHPSCLVIEDPEFRTIDRICEVTRAAGEAADLCDLATLARRAAR